MKKAYISGKVTGLPIQEVRQKFARKEFELIGLGYDKIFNPVSYIEKFEPKVFEEIFNGSKEDYNAQMRCCIANLMIHEEIHLLEDWEDSKGAIIEVEIAKTIGISIIYP